MAEHINRKAIETKVKRFLMPNVDDNGTVSVEDAERYFLNLLANQPTADVVEVVHGEWEWHKDHWECSVCRGSRFHDLVLGLDAAHCGYCGAKMDGKKDA